MPPLAETQRRFFDALQFPLRGTSRRSTELPASDEPHDPAFLSTAHDLLRPSPTLIPAECLELYHRQYWFRLLDSVAEDFPGLKTLLGNERFWNLLENYLLAHPSQSFTLRHLGRAMPRFVGKEITDPVLRRRAIAIATVEWSMMACFEAAELPPATARQVADESFTLQAHVRLLETEADASAWLHDPESGWREGDRHHAAVWRTREGGVRHRSLEPGEFAMLSLLHGRPWSLDDWLEESAPHIPGTDTLSRWCATWQADGWFAII